ncbi:hypothetical protein GCM10017714_13000 [Curtobacterium pusillum]|uniref:Uncharacterized protein n=1 Tax=Curtobacterium pusillum TaxID=69373 RepID=A0ABX2M8D2_9MICO|nr:hypothetical protein [Curtobacterium pusillum]NUU13160.1 hypothetical protein [Curtobacterium pusillum]GLK30561.1 hypothetical protein GCM10017610_08460 [Curtobacterium pusillum]
MPDTDMLDRLIRTAVRTDDDVVDLVADLVERPITRQCWVLFLDERAVPVSFVMPISDLPWQPDEHVEDFAALVADVLVQVAATEVVLVWERPGESRLFPVDWEWVDACACAFEERHVRLRAQVAVHTGGIAIVSLDEVDEADHGPIALAS